MTRSPSSYELSAWTTLRVGGPASGWVTAETDDDIHGAVASGDRLLVLGGGSNLVVADAGVDATVVQVATRGVSAKVRDGLVQLEVMAGEAWDELVEHCVREGWSGIEAMSGIPGRVGATPVQNVGAYGQEVSDVIEHVRVLDRSTSMQAVLSPAQCDFGYRTSALKAQPDRYIVLSVGFRLRESPDGAARYGELASTLGVPVGGAARIDEIRAAVLELRRRKGMVLDPDDHDTWSAGSFFTNPIVDDSTARALPAECPRYPAATGTKVSAAWLIAQAGIARGFALPGSRAAVSTKHVLALTNRGGATAAEILELAAYVQHRVREACGLELQAEPVIVA